MIHSTDSNHVDQHSSTEGSRSQEREHLVSTCRVPATETLYQTLHRLVLGQDESIDRIICSFARVVSGLRDPGRPLLTMLLLGPTGVGKTETAKALARSLFGSERAMTRINAEEYSSGHEIAKLLGSPPGYVGHDIEPLLSQSRLDAPHLEAIQRGEGTLGLRKPAAGDPTDSSELTAPTHPISILLIDEIEKAHPKVWNALLGILEDGMLTLGDNETTDFTHTIILVTSNVGSREMGEYLHHRPMGFVSEDPPAEAAPESLDAMGRKAAFEVFPTEFLNRFDDILVYNPLDHLSLEKVFDKFLHDIQQRAATTGKTPLLLTVTPEARDWLIEKGTDARLGARPLRRVMETHIVDELSRLIASHKISPGDVIEVDRCGEGVAMFRTQHQAGLILANPATTSATE